jgi:hypothetical protein
LSLVKKYREESWFLKARSSARRRIRIKAAVAV